MTYVYHLILVQVWNKERTELCYVFSTLATFIHYLEDIWGNWEKTLGPEDLDRIPPLPLHGEITAGLAANTNPTTGFPSYTFVSVGFLGGEDHSVHATVTKMPVF